jgi:hypothetical protein
MARQGEKTIKLTADTADVQKAFARVEDAYGEVAKAAADYAEAVDRSSKAVTADEQKIAAEHEKATKQILNSSKRRAGALKTQAVAMGEQQKSLKSSISGEKMAEKQSAALTKTSTNASKAGMSKAAAFGVAAVAAGVMVKAIGAAVDVSRQMVGAMLKSKDITDEQRASLMNLQATFDAYDEAQKAVKEGITFVVAEFAKFGKILSPLQNALNAVVAEIKWLVKHGTLMAQLFGSMVVNMESLEDASKRLHKVNKDIADDAQKKIASDKAEAQVLKNLEERKAAIEKGDKQREKDAQDRAASASRRAQQRKEDDEAAIQDARALAEAEELAIKENAEKDVADALAKGATLATETQTRLGQELELRQALERQKAQAAGADMEALETLQQLERDLFDIRSSGASDEEKERATRLTMLNFEIDAFGTLMAKKKEADATIAESNKAAIAAAEGAGVAALEQAGLTNVAVGIAAGKKAAFYAGESFAAFGALNPVSGALFAAAAVQQASVAGGAVMGNIPKGGGGSVGKSPASVSPTSRASQSMAPASAGPRETGITITNNMLSYIAPEDARRIAVSEAREARAVVGGRK